MLFRISKRSEGKKKMKMIFFSDIHGRTTYLEKLGDIIVNGNFDKIIVLGDIFDYFFNEESKKVEEFLKQYQEKLIIMRGNCDYLDHIEKSSLTFTYDIAMITVDKVDIYLTHGNKYHKDNNSIFMNGVMVYGHEHIPYIIKEEDIVYLNTGSISLPRNEKGPTYTVYENRCFIIYSILNGKVIDSISL